MKIHSNNPSKLKLQILHQLLESKSDQKSKFDQISKWVPRSTQILDKENLLTKKQIKKKLKSLSNEKLKQQSILSNTLSNQQQNFQTPVSDSKYKKQQSFYNKQSSVSNYLNEIYDINNNNSPIQFQKNSKSFSNLQQQQLFSENEKLNQINSSFEMEDYKLFYNEDRNEYIQFMKKLKRAHSSINFQNDNLNNMNASQFSQNFNQNQTSGTFKENLINNQILQQQYFNQNQGSKQQGHDLMFKSQSQQNFINTMPRQIQEQNKYNKNNQQFFHENHNQKNQKISVSNLLKNLQQQQIQKRDQDNLKNQRSLTTQEYFSQHNNNKFPLFNNDIALQENKNHINNYSNQNFPDFKRNQKHENKLQIDPNLKKYLNINIDINNTAQTPQQQNVSNIIDYLDFNTQPKQKKNIKLDQIQDKSLTQQGQAQSLYEHLLDNSKMRANFLQLSTGNIKLTNSKKKLSQLYSSKKLQQSQNQNKENIGEGTKYQQDNLNGTNEIKNYEYNSQDFDRDSLLKVINDLQKKDQKNLKKISQLQQQLKNEQMNGQKMNLKIQSLEEQKEKDLKHMQNLERLIRSLQEKIKDEPERNKVLEQYEILQNIYKSPLKEEQCRLQQNRAQISEYVQIVQQSMKEKKKTKIINQEKVQVNHQLIQQQRQKSRELSNSKKKSIRQFKSPSKNNCSFNNTNQSLNFSQTKTTSFQNNTLNSLNSTSNFQYTPSQMQSNNQIINLNASHFKDEKNYMRSNQQNSDNKGNPFLQYNYNYQKSPEKQIQQSVQLQQQYQNVQSQESEKKQNQSLQSNSKNKYLSLNDKKNQILKNMNKPQPYQNNNVSIQSQNQQSKFQNFKPNNEKNQQENIRFSQIKNIQKDSSLKKNAHLMPEDQSRDNSLERQIQLFQEQQIQKRIKHNNEPQDQEQQLQKTIKINNNQFRKNLHDNSSANQLTNSQVTNSQSHIQNYNHKIQEDSSSPLKTDMITSDRIQQKKRYQNDQFSTQKNNFHNKNNEYQQKLNNSPQTFYQQEESKNFSYNNQNNKNNSKNDFKNPNNSFITNDNNDQLYSFQQNNFTSDFDGKYNSKLNISDIQPHNLSSKLQEQLLTTIEKGILDSEKIKNKEKQYLLQQKQQINYLNQSQQSQISLKQKYSNESQDSNKNPNNTSFSPSRPQQVNTNQYNNKSIRNTDHIENNYQQDQQQKQLQNLQAETKIDKKIDNLTNNIRNVINQNNNKGTFRQRNSIINNSQNKDELSSRQPKFQNFI